MPEPLPPLADNPYDDEFRKMRDDGRRFMVVHLGVGDHPAGKVVGARDLGPGAQLPRLVALGAVREMSPDEVRAHEAATGGAAGQAAPAPSSVIKPTGTGPEVPPAPAGKPSPIPAIPPK